MTDRERLVAALVRARKRAGLTRVQVARELDCSPETVRRMEERDLNLNAPHPRVVRYLLEIYRVESYDRAQLFHLARELYQQRRTRT